MPPSTITRRNLLKAAGTLGLSLAATGGLPSSARAAPADDPIKVGVLYSLTGNLALTETPLQQATLLAIEEINRAGGVLGRKVEAVVEDGETNFTTVFPEKARKLLEKDKVAAVFGCWTSVSYRNVLPVVEEYEGVLFYPAFHEGNHSSPHLVYAGPLPNQQFLPAVDWLLDKAGGQKKQFFLLGSDYVYPRTVNPIVAKHLDGRGLKPAGERYTPFGHREYAAIVREIKERQADVVLSTLSGDSNVYFFDELAAQGLTAEKLPVCSVTLDEDDLRVLDPAKFKGHLVARSYCQSIDSKPNREFVARFRKKYGKDRVTTQDIEAAYSQVYLWKQAVEKAKSAAPERVREAIRGQEFDAPGGRMKIDEKNNHAWRKFRMARVNKDRQFDILFESKEWIKPNPYPPPLKRPKE